MKIRSLCLGMLGVAAVLAVAGCRPKGPPGALASSGYHVRGKVVWYKGSWTSQAVELSGVDLASFEYPLPNAGSSPYARDKNHVYWGAEPLAGVDPKTFRLIDPPFSRDNKHIYHGGYIVCDDPDHFERVSPIFVKNSHAVYAINSVQGSPEERLISRNPAGFRLLEADGPGFFADGNELMVSGTRFADIKPADFQYLGDSYWRAGDRAFYFVDEMPDGVDAAALKPLTGQYASDGLRVFYLGRVLEGADPGTFSVTDPKWPRARDAYRDYDQGNPVERPAAAP